MPATNLPELLDFETHFETTAQAVLAAAGVPAFISSQGVQIPLISCGVSFDLSPAFDDRTFIPKPTNWPAGRPGPQEYFRFPGQLEFRVEVPRDRNMATIAGVPNLFSQFRGLTRAAFLRCMAPFNVDNLPFYEVADIKPAGSITGYEGVRNIDFSALRFALTFAIRPEAWPVWVES